MSLSVGGSKRRIAEINVVPLIDILLVLIIIFMVISPVTAKGHGALLPQEKTADSAGRPPEHPVIVQLLSDGQMKLNGELQTWETLGARIEEVFKQRADKVVFVQSENAVLFSQVARAIDVIRSHGVEKVGLMTSRIANGE
jgi:biopolymer transport protein ExbD